MRTAMVTANWRGCVVDPAETWTKPAAKRSGNVSDQYYVASPGQSYFHRSSGFACYGSMSLPLEAMAQTYLEILWGGSWLVGTAGGGSYFVRTRPSELDRAYLHMLTDKGPPRAL
jgi:hypothetical protein